MSEHGRREEPKGQRHPRCKCGAKAYRDETHDAYYCPVGMVWLEERCSDPKCRFCRKRPEKP